jgi:hypothetical protein
MVQKIFCCWNIFKEGLLFLGTVCMHQNMELSLPTAATTQGVLFGGSSVYQSVEV